jgi:hypothetical protein
LLAHFNPDWASDRGFVYVLGARGGGGAGRRRVLPPPATPY